MVSVHSQALTQTKGDNNLQASEQDQNKAPNKKPTQGIATGNVSELAKGADKWALIIGISDYAGTVNDLNYCDDDAQDFYNALVNIYDWKPSHIIVLINEQATEAAIMSAIDVLSTREQAGDEVVFFYSGHGSLSTYDIDSDNERKDECIIPYECQQSYFIWDGELKMEFSTFESNRIMFFFDSCYAGGMTDLVAPGRLILMACGENQLSIESSTWENGQFTYYFADQGMLNHKADLNSDQKVTFEEAFDYAKAHCRSQTPTASDSFACDMLP